MNKKLYIALILLNFTNSFSTPARFLGALSALRMRGFKTNGAPTLGEWVKARQVDETQARNAFHNLAMELVKRESDKLTLLKEDALGAGSPIKSDGK